MFPVLIILAACLYAFLAWRDLRLGLFLIAAALPSYLIRFSMFGLPATLLEILVIILIIIWLAKRPFRVRSDPKWFFPITLLLIAATIGIFVAPNKIAALGIWKSYFIEPLFLFVIALDLLKDKKHAAQLITYLGIGALFVAAFAIFQKFTLWAVPAPWDAEGRVTSIFPYPNAVGLYLGPIICLGFFQILSSFKLFKPPLSSVKLLKLLFWPLTIILSTLAIIFAQTEAAYFAIPAAIALALIIFTKYRRPALIFCAIIITLIALFPPARQTVWQKISFQDYSGTVRLAQWDETGNFLKDNLLFGAGLSGYPAALIPYHTHSDIEIFQYPHNLVFNIWTELGLLGLLASFLILYQLGRRLVVSHPTNLMAAGAAAAILEMLIHGLVDVPYLKNDLAVLTWLIFALLILSTKNSPNQPASKINDRLK